MQQLLFWNFCATYIAIANAWYFTNIMLVNRLLNYTGTQKKKDLNSSMLKQGVIHFQQQCAL